MTILLIGNCGSGKTWVMKQLILEYKMNVSGYVGKAKFKANDKFIVMGRYNGSVFDGSDRLSMSVMTDFDSLKKIQEIKNLHIVSEGDRFMNKKFIEIFNPFIIKISDNGLDGIKKRGSTQSVRQLKSISTRVKNIKENIIVKNSDEALIAIKKILKNEKN